MKKTLINIFIFTLFLSNIGFSQIKTSETNDSFQTEMDSIKFFLKTNNPVRALKLINNTEQKILKSNSTEFYQKLLLLKGFALKKTGNYNEAIKVFSKAISLFNKTKDTLTVSKAYNGIAQVEMLKGNFYNAIKNIEKTIQYKILANDKKGEGIAYNTLGNIYFQLGNNEKAIKNYESALKIFDEINFIPGKATVYNEIGVVYDNMANYENIENFREAENYYKKAIELFKQLNDSVQIALTMQNTGIIHSQLFSLYNNKNNKTKSQKEFNIAKKYFKESYSILKKYGIKNKIPDILINLAALYMGKKDFDESIKHLNTALEYGNEIDLPAYMQANIYYYLASAYFNKNNIDKAQQYINKSIEIAKQTGLKKNLAESYNLLADIYRSSGEYQKSIDALKKYISLKDTLLNEETNRLIQQFGVKEKQRELELKQVQIQKKEAENRAQRTFIYALSLLIFLILAIVVLVFKQYRDKKKANEMLEAKNKLILQQKQEITDSILYAQNIQTAILPPLSEIEKIANGFSLLFMPKDIVSGDFYWSKYLPDQDILYIAVADCTGHGVSGAFMSMLGISFLNEITTNNKFLLPGEILNRLRKKIITSLHNLAKDGMDISFVAIDNQKKTVYFSGAFNPLYLIRHKNKTAVEAESTLENENFILYELKGDRMPIGYSPKYDDFSTKMFDYIENDILILFSDGYADQFGGPKGKKFKYKKFKNLLLSSANLEPEQTKTILYNAFTEWKGNHEQTDDVTVMEIVL